MGKISFANMKLKLNTEVNTFEFNGENIEILKYLPIEDKYSLIMVTLQDSLENGYYNPIKKDMHFHLNLIYLYTNISFTDKQREDESKLYDLIKSNGLMDAFLKAFPEEEYNELFELIQETEKSLSAYHRSAAALIQSLINDLPKQAEAAANIVKNFDPQKYQNVIDFAKAANDGRDI